MGSILTEVVQLLSLYSFSATVSAKMIPYDEPQVFLLVSTAPDAVPLRGGRSMEWFTRLASKWQRVIIAMIVILLLVGTQLLREMIKTEGTEPDKDKGTAIRYLLRPMIEKVTVGSV